jgi:hypothetical protein
MSNKIEDVSTYITHSNGEQPFRITVGKITNTVQVYDNEIILKRGEIPVPLFTFNPIRVWIGKSPMNPMTISSGDYGPAFDGNTVLLKVCDQKTSKTDNSKSSTKESYIFIANGHDILQFKALAEITEFISPIGNNDVPYPYAIDQLGNIYLLIEQVILLNRTMSKIKYNAKTSKLQTIPQIPPHIKNDPYVHYYKTRVNITRDEGVRAYRSIAKPPSEVFYDFTDAFIGKEKFTMTFAPNPAKNYDFLTKNGVRPMTVRTSLNQVRAMTKQDYIKLQQDFAQRFSLRPLVAKTIKS